MAKKERVPRGKVVMSELGDSDRILLAKHGDSEALGYIWEHSVPLVNRICGRFANKYDWVDHNDLVQEVLLQVPKIVARFDLSKNTLVDKFLYFSFYRAAQDALRRLDPLGMRFPQRKKHPAFLHLSEIERRVTDSDYAHAGNYESIRDRAHENILRGYLHTTSESDDG